MSATTGSPSDSARAGPLERDLADRVALEHHGVERPLDRRERVVRVDERRADADVDAPSSSVARASSLTRISSAFAARTCS